MTLIAINTIKHNGVIYNPGNVLPEMKKSEAERLINLKAAKFDKPVNNDKKEKDEGKKTEIKTDTQNQNNKTTDKKLDKVSKYSSMAYIQLVRLVEDRKIKTESKETNALIQALDADDAENELLDAEFNSLVEQCKLKGIEIPDEASIEDLTVLLNNNQ